MKILIVNSLYPPHVIGGAEISTQKLVDELASRGEKVSVLTTGETDTIVEKNGVKIYYRRFHNIMPFWDFKHARIFERVLWKGLDYISLQNKEVIEEVIKIVDPDVIHLNTIYGITPYIWKVAKSNHLPIVQTLRDYNFMCPKSNLMTKGNTTCTEPKALCKIYRHGYRNLSKYVDVVTAPSRYTLNCFLKDNYFINASDYVIYNAIDFNEGDFKAIADKRLHQSKKKQKNVIFIGSFIETKGVNILLKAINNCPENIIFHFAGKGRLEDDIRALAKQHSNVIVHGFLSEKELNELLSEMDMLVCPSIWAEPFGRVIIDAYKACIPAIVSNCGGMPELIDEGLTGRIVTPGSPEELSRAIIEMSYKDINQEVVTAIWNRLQMFSIKKQGEDFCRVYKNLVRET